MRLSEFLNTKKVPQKYVRHIAFWICTLIPFFIMGVIAIYSKHATVSAGDFLRSQFDRLPNLSIDIAYTYIVAYLFIPKFRRDKSRSLLASRIITLTVLAFILKAFLWYDADILSVNQEKLWISGWFLVTNFFNDGCMMRCGLFLGCKVLKSYYIRNEEKIGIIKENATAELQLLKAQVHPHFLFNTLNNIYSFSLKRSPVAASLVAKLSDTLQYMITECEADLVPLEKELKMIKDYIGLESVRYGTRLKMHIEITGDPKDKTIAPLLLIPIVENSFKHGTSQMLGKPWVKLKIDIRETELEFLLANCKPVQSGLQDRRNGIGLKNVKKRMQLLYPGQHSFNIINGDDTFEVLIHIPIHRCGDNLQFSNSSFDKNNLILVYGSR